MSAPTSVNQEKHTLEMIDGSFPVRDEREEALWRAFVAMFAHGASPAREVLDRDGKASHATVALQSGLLSREASVLPEFC